MGEETTAVEKNTVSEKTTAVEKNTAPFGQWIWNENGSIGKDGLEGELEGTRDAILSDIDGVISDAFQRQHFLAGKERDWDGFFSACVQDEPIYNMTELLNWLNPELSVVLLTARPYRISNETVEWLKRNSIRWDLLVIRSEGQGNLSAKDFKAEAAKSLHQAGFNFLVGFEDDPANVETLKNAKLMGAAKIPCVYVHSGYYDNKEPSDPPTY